MHALPSVQTLQAQADSQARDLQAAHESRAQAEERLAAAQQEHGVQAAELRRTAEALRNALEDQRADSSEQLRRTQERLERQVAAAQGEAGDARREACQLAAELEEAQVALEVQHTALQQQLERICSERESHAAAVHATALAEVQRERQQLAAALADAQHERQVLAERHAALQDCVEQQQQELAAARVSGLRRLTAGRMGVLPMAHLLDCRRRHADILTLASAFPSAVRAWQLQRNLRAAAGAAGCSRAASGSTGCGAGAQPARTARHAAPADIPA